MAAVVATLGLLTNGTALISPIMNSIIAMSFSMTLEDSEMFSKYINGIILGTLIAITVSIFITLFLPSRSLISEILSRIKPTIIDLVIALASGVAGAYTMCHKMLPGAGYCYSSYAPSLRCGYRSCSK